MRPYQQRAFTMLTFGDESMQLEPEVAIPQAARAIDGILTVGNATPGWGVIREFVDNRQVAVEHFRRSINFDQYLTARLKLAWLVDEWARRRRPHGQRPPALLILTGAHPRHLLQRVGHLAAQQTSGIFALLDPTGDVVLVDTKNLAPVDGTAVLRCTRPAETEREVARLRAILLADPTLPTLTRNRIMEFIMTDKPTLSSYPEIERYGFTAAYNKRFEAGERKILQAIMAKMPPRLRDELELIDDLDELRRRCLDYVPATVVT